jgi:hypothetical protein
MKLPAVYHKSDRVVAGLDYDCRVWVWECCLWITTITMTGENEDNFNFMQDDADNDVSSAKLIEVCTSDSYTCCCTRLYHYNSSHGMLCSRTVMGFDPTTCRLCSYAYWHLNLFRPYFNTFISIRRMFHVHHQWNHSGVSLKNPSVILCSSILCLTNHVLLSS